MEVDPRKEYRRAALAAAPLFAVIANITGVEQAYSFFCIVYYIVAFNVITVCEPIVAVCQLKFH